MGLFDPEYSCCNRVGVRGDFDSTRRELDELKAYQLENAPSSDEDSDEENEDDQEDQDLSAKTPKELTELLKEIGDILVCCIIASNLSHRRVYTKQNVGYPSQIGH